MEIVRLLLTHLTFYRDDKGQFKRDETVEFDSDDELPEPPKGEMPSHIIEKYKSSV
jgi:hypothetical protein